MWFCWNGEAALLALSDGHLKRVLIGHSLETRRSVMHLDPRSRFSARVLLLLTLIVSSLASSQQRDGLQQSELGLEINLPDEIRPGVRLAGGGVTLILRRSLRVTDP